MEVNFKNKNIEKIFKGKYSGKQKFANHIIRKFRSLVYFMRISKSLGDLSKTRSLNVEKYQKHYSVRITKQFRLEFEFVKPNKLILIKISKHYE